MDAPVFTCAPVIETERLILRAHAASDHEAYAAIWADPEVVRYTSGRLAGEVGFHDLRRDIEPSFDGTPEAGWLLAPEFHGQGLAREALVAIHAWGDAHLRSSTTVCIIHPDHEASLRVARQFGYGNPVPTRYHDAPSLILTRDRPSDS